MADTPTGTIYMKFPPKSPQRDASFFQYKLVQMMGLLLLSLIVYCVFVFFDLGRFEDKKKINRPLTKDELKPQGIFKKYLKPDESKK